jgi:hypothetical protein
VSAAAFDFLHGRWIVRNRRLDDPLDTDGASWIELDALVETIPVLQGAGNIDLYSAPRFPGRGPDGLEAVTLRLYDAAEDLWRIWWASTSSGGQIDVPVVGGFSGNHGVFRCDDTLGGRPAKVLYEWLDADTVTPHWRQSFSFDDGRTWAVNWEMRLERATSQRLSRPR